MDLVASTDFWYVAGASLLIRYQCKSHPPMRKQRTIILLVGIFLAMIALIFWPRKQAGETNQLRHLVPSPPVLPTVPKIAATLGPMQAMMETPILFYGIVLDQGGTPIP